MVEITADDDQEIVRPVEQFMRLEKCCMTGPEPHHWSSHLANHTPGSPGVVTWSVFCAGLMCLAQPGGAARLTFYRQEGTYRCRQIIWPGLFKNILHS